MEFWEKAFQEKRLMWGEEPAKSATEAAGYFKENGFRKILIPGFGYGRNAKPFIDAGMNVTGIEISGTAIEYGKGIFGSGARIIHGSVADMPFDTETYDGIYSHALIHLLDASERRKFIADCSGQLKEAGSMVFTSITKNAGSFGIGQQVGPDRFRTKDGVDLLFYDESSIRQEFGSSGLIEAVRYDEPVHNNPALTTEFWKITCQRKQAR